MTNKKNGMDELSRKLINCLKEILHDDLLIGFFGEIDPEECCESEEKPCCQVIFSIWVSSARQREIWFLNEKRIRGNDRLIMPAEKKQLMDENLARGPYDPASVTVKIKIPQEQESEITWEFEAGEVVDGTAGSGYEGLIVYDRKEESFSFQDVRSTWIA